MTAVNAGDENGLRAFTIIEAVVIVATLLALCFLLLPAARHAKQASDKRCAYNLKQIGLAFKTWPGDGDLFPMSCPTTNGGAKEHAEAGQVFFNFLVMSNELSGDPKFLVCPWDKARKPAKVFGPGLSDTNVSYFVSLDGNDTLPQAFLSGDRNLAYAGRALPHGIFPVATNAVLTWTEEVHKSCGNILLCDGSVQFLDQAKLVRAIQGQGLGTNRLSIP